MKVTHDSQLNDQFLESEWARRDWDRRLKSHIKSTNPDSLIWLEYRNYWKKGETGATERAYEAFLDEAELDAWLGAWHQAEWNDYCNGHGDPSLSYLEIRIKRPGGDWKDYKA